jgi:hypothetical protein
MELTDWESTKQKENTRWGTAAPYNYKYQCNRELHTTGVL